MADDVIRDPQHQASLEKLRAEFEALAQQFDRSAATLDTATRRTETSTSELEQATRQEVARRQERLGTGVTGSEPAVVEQATVATDRLATAQRAATAAIEQRLSLERQEAQLVAQIATAQDRARQAAERQAQAQIARGQARTEFRQVSRQAEAGVGAAQARLPDAAAAQAQANERARLAGLEVRAATRNISGLEAQLAPLQAQLADARALEAAGRQELAQASERVRLGAQVGAAMQARIRQLEGLGVGPAETPTPQVNRTADAGVAAQRAAEQLAAAEQAATVAAQERLGVEQREQQLAAQAAAARAQVTPDTAAAQQLAAAEERATVAARERLALEEQEAQLAQRIAAARSQAPAPAVPAPPAEPTVPFRITPFVAGEAAGSDISNPQAARDPVRPSGYSPQLADELARGGATMNLTARSLRDLGQWAENLIPTLRDMGNTSGVRSFERLSEQALAAAAELDRQAAAGRQVESSASNLAQAQDRAAAGTRPAAAPVTAPVDPLLEQRRQASQIAQQLAVEKGSGSANRPWAIVDPTVGEPGFGALRGGRVQWANENIDTREGPVTAPGPMTYQRKRDAEEALRRMQQGALPHEVMPQALSADWKPPDMAPLERATEQQAAASREVAAEDQQLSARLRAAAAEYDRALADADRTRAQQRQALNDEMADRRRRTSSDPAAQGAVNREAFARGSEINRQYDQAIAGPQARYHELQAQRQEQPDLVEQARAREATAASESAAAQDQVTLSLREQARVLRDMGVRMSEAQLRVLRQLEQGESLSANQRAAVRNVSQAGYVAPTRAFPSAPENTIAGQVRVNGLTAQGEQLLRELNQEIANRVAAERQAGEAEQRAALSAEEQLRNLEANTGISLRPRELQLLDRAQQAGAQGYRVPTFEDSQQAQAELLRRQLIQPQGRGREVTITDQGQQALSQTLPRAQQALEREAAAAQEAAQAQDEFALSLREQVRLLRQQGVRVTEAQLSALQAAAQSEKGVSAREYPAARNLTGETFTGKGALLQEPSYGHGYQPTQAGNDLLDQLNEAVRQETAARRRAAEAEQRAALSTEEMLFNLRQRGGISLDPRQLGILRTAESAGNEGAPVARGEEWQRALRGLQEQRLVQPVPSYSGRPRYGLTEEGGQALSNTLPTAETRARFDAAYRRVDDGAERQARAQQENVAELEQELAQLRQRVQGARQAEQSAQDLARGLRDEAAAGRDAAAAQQRASSELQSQLGPVQAQLELARRQEQLAGEAVAAAERELAVKQEIYAAEFARLQAERGTPPPAPPPAPPAPPSGPPPWRGTGGAQPPAYGIEAEAVQRTVQAAQQRAQVEQQAAGAAQRVADLEAQQQTLQQRTLAAEEEAARTVQAQAQTQIAVQQALSERAAAVRAAARGEASTGDVVDAEAQVQAAREAARTARDANTAAQRNLASLQSQAEPLAAELEDQRRLALELRAQTAEGQAQTALYQRLTTLLAGRAEQLEASAAQQTTGFRGFGGAQPPAFGLGGQAVAQQQAARAQAPVPQGPAPQAGGGINLNNLTQTQAGVTQAQQARQAALAAAVQQASQIANATRSVGTASEYEARMVSLSSQAYERHGALQTEWLQALSKGQVTLRDFGDQMVSTIGKFAGWSTAAASVYGVLGAVSELGKGALDGVSGVSNLQRTITGLDTGRAGEQIRDLATGTNTSLKDAGDAVFQFSRTFHDQNDAVYAARLALMAYKLDGVSLSDQVRSQTAITSQYGLTAQGLGPIYGLLAQGQREYNARVTEMIPLIGNSVAQIRNAGGDLTEYVKIGQLALRTTGQTGATIATAFRRSPGFIQQPKNQQILTALGFDPQDALRNYTGFIEEAIRKSRDFTGQQRRELVQGLFGNQQGPRLAPLFNAAPDLVNQILGQNVKSASPLLEEFSKYMAVPRTQLEGLGKQLQALGSRLASSGLLTGLGVIVHALDDGLKGANALLKAFDAMPAPLRTAVGLFAALRVGSAVVGRFPGGGQQGGFGAAFSSAGAALNPRRTATKEVEKLLDEEQGYYRDMQESARTRTLRLQRSLVAQQAIVTDLVQGNATADEQKVAVDRYNQLLTQQNRSIQEEYLLRRDIQVLDQQRVQFLAAIAKGATVPSAAAAANIGFTGPLGRPTGTIPDPIGATRGGVILPPGVQGPYTQPQAQAAAAAAAANTAATSTFTGAYKNALSGNAAAQAALATSMTGATGQLETLSLRARAGASAANLANAATAAATGGLRLLAGFMNPWTIGLFVLPEVFGSIANAEHEMKAATDAANQALERAGGSSSVGDMRAAAEKLRDLAKRQAEREKIGFLQGIPLISQAAKFIADADHTVSTLLLSEPTIPGPPSKSERNFTRAQAIDDLAATWQGLEQQAQEAARIDRGSQAARERFYALMPELKMVAQLAVGTSGLTGQDAQRQLQNFYNKLQTVYQGFQNALPVAPVGGNNPFAQFQTQSLDNNIKNLQALADHARLYGATNDQLKQMAYLYTYIVGSQSRSMDSTTLQKVDQAQTAFQTAIHQQVQGMIDQANAITVPTVKAGGEAARIAALNARTQILKRAGTLLAQLQGLVPGAVNTLADVDHQLGDTLHQAQVSLLEAQRSFGQVILTGATNLMNDVRGILGFAPVSARTTAAAKAAQNAVDQARNALRAMPSLQASKQAATKVGSDLAPLADQIANAQQTAANSIAGTTNTGATSDAFEIQRLRREIAKAEAQGDPVAAAGASISEAHDEIHAAKNEKEKLQGQLDLVNAENELTSALKQVADARFQYLAALVQNDPVASAGVDIQKARAAISHATPGTPDYYTGLADLARANDTQQKAAEEVTQARYKYLETLTTNPLKIDQLEVQAKTEALAHAVHGTAAYYTALADRNQALQKYRDDRVSEREDDVQFQLSMNDITTEQAMQDIEALLKIKDLSYETRKRLRRELEQLKKGSESQFGDLNLDSIRLPTPYEIRRATLAATQGVNVTQNYSTSIHVTDTRSAAAVGTQMDRYHRGTGKAVQRAIGHRG